MIMLYREIFLATLSVSVCMIMHSISVVSISLQVLLKLVHHSTRSILFLARFANSMIRHVGLVLPRWRSTSAVGSHVEGRVRSAAVGLEVYNVRRKMLKSSIAKFRKQKRGAGLGIRESIVFRSRPPPELSPIVESRMRRKCGNDQVDGRGT